jgi:hypothetical protein
MGTPVTVSVAVRNGRSTGGFEREVVVPAVAVALARWVAWVALGVGALLAAVAVVPSALLTVLGYATLFALLVLGPTVLAWVAAGRQ